MNVYLLLLLVLPCLGQGYLTVITGPMFAKKTGTLIELIRKAHNESTNIAVFRHTLDTRSEHYLTSRAYPNEKIESIPVNNPQEIVEYYLHQNAQVLVIDEAQFFDIRLLAAIGELIMFNAKIYIAGLDTNFKGEPFGPCMGTLCLMADKVVKMTALCGVCKQWTATMTQRLVNGKPASHLDPEIIVDDGTNKIVSYEPRCRNCHILQ